MSLSEEPARKLFINQCLNLKPGDYSRHEVQKKYRPWTLIFQNKPLLVGLIWIQGIIVNVSKSPDSTFKLDDGTGIATVLSAHEAPGYGPGVTNGQYVMVIGEVLATQPSLDVRVLKLTKLPESNAETLWNLEVQDFWKFLEIS